MVRRQAMLDEYKAATEAYKSLLESANDQAVSEAEREKRKQNAEAKLLQIRELEQQVAQFDRSARSQLGTKQRQVREKILAEIQQVIASKARAAGYNLVLDAASQTINETPVVLFTDNAHDLTEPVLAQLNQGAPVEFTAPAGKK